MANKQYISIIRLFQHCDIATGNDFNLSRAKKNLQAEFNIANGGLIEVEQHVYTRQHVMEELELPDFEKRLVYHRRIWECKHILELLENNTTDLWQLKPELQLFLKDSEFDNFFSPYFVGPFSYYSRTLLNEGRLKEAGLLLDFEDFLQPPEREEAFRSIRLFLDDNIRTLRNVNKENYKLMRPNMEHWVDAEWSDFMNFLPSDLYEKKTEIATILVNIGVAVQKSNRKDCRKMSDQLVELQEMPESLRTVISSNHLIYQNSASKFSFKGNWWIVWVLILAIRAISSGSCNDRSSRDTYRIQPAEFKFITGDSLLKNRLKNADSARNTADSFERDTDSFSEQLKRVKIDTIQLR